MIGIYFSKIYKVFLSERLSIHNIMFSCNRQYNTTISVQIMDTYNFSWAFGSTFLYFLKLALFFLGIYICVIILYFNYEKMKNKSKPPSRQSVGIFQVKLFPKLVISFFTSTSNLSKIKR